MTDQPPSDPPREEPHRPSLADRVRTWRPRDPRNRGTAARGRSPLGPAFAVLLIALAIADGAIWASVRQRRAETAALAGQAAFATEARDRLAAFAAVAGRAPLATDLARLAGHLPPDTRLAGAGRDEPGALSLAIDSPDPDLLRGAFATDPLLGRLAVRGQEMRDEGVFRVRFSGAVE